MSDEKKPETRITPVDRMMMTVQSQQARIESMFPPGTGMKIERMMTQVRLALNRNEDLLKCTPGSIVQSVVTAAELGLDPSGRLGSGWIVPFRDQAQFIPGYRGLIDLAVRSGEVKQVKATIVFWGDEFDYEEGDKPRLWHKPAKPSTPDEMKVFKPPTAEDVRAAYAVATLADGSKQFTVMERWELDRIRARSPGAKSYKSPWNNEVDRIEMYRKCPVRKLCKNLALSPEKARLLGLALEKDPDEPGSEGEKELNQIVPQEERGNADGNIASIPPIPKSKADSLKDKLGTEDAVIVETCGRFFGPKGEFTCALSKGHLSDGTACEDDKGNIG